MGRVAYGVTSLKKGLVGFQTISTAQVVLRVNILAFLIFSPISSNLNPESHSKRYPAGRTLCSPLTT